MVAMNAGMQALVAEGGEVRLVEVPLPRLRNASDVLIRVVAAGICRTDAYVAHGQIPIHRAVTLGHELSGIVVASGRAACEFERGSRVTANPVVSCGTCDGCQKSTTCYRPTTVGIEHHGCFAEYIVLPAALLHRIPEGMTPFEAAYVEPVASCLAIFDAGIAESDCGVVAGSNRFARLARALLAQREYRGGSEAVDLAECSLDYAVETGMDPQVLAALVRALKPGGTLVLKSRSPVHLPLCARDLVLKNLKVHAVSYGSFGEAIALLAGGKVALDPQQVRQVSLQDYQRALSDNPDDESGKSFFVLSGGGEWPSCAA